MNEDRLDSLLSVWQEQQAMGRDIQPAELCRDCPELVDELNQRIQALRQMNALLQQGGAPPGADPADANLPTLARTLRAQSVNPDAAGTPCTPSEGRPVPARALVSVPGYEIVEELGRGGMGVVYKARHLKLNRIVALKMILAGSHAGVAELSRFQTEAEAIARLQHPNIVQVYEVGEHEGKPFFSLEFCGGGSLAKKLNGTPLPACEAAALVETLARAMHAAHEQQIVHRDLKPANVLLVVGQMLQPASGVRVESLTYSPKITDFGLAKKLDEAGQTQSGAVMGTPSYMAPEQAAGRSSEVGPLADVYALGAILYECLTGRPPFRAATALDTMLQVRNEEPVPPSQYREVPHDLQSVCLKCLEKDQHRRYASAQDLADDLRRFREEEPVVAAPIDKREWAARWARSMGYELLQEIGRGGMGVVYKAQQISLKRLVALKTIHSQSADEERAHRFLRDEAEVAARLQHPNIVQIYDFGGGVICLSSLAWNSLAEIACKPDSGTLHWRRGKPHGFSRRWRKPCITSTSKAWCIAI